jgi:hypothetical protein
MHLGSTALPCPRAKLLAWRFTMTVADVLLSFVYALFGGVVLLAGITVKRAVIRLRRRRPFVSRRFMRRYRAECSAISPMVIGARVPSLPLLLLRHLGTVDAVDTPATARVDQEQQAA